MQKTFFCIFFLFFVFSRRVTVKLGYWYELLSVRSTVGSFVCNGCIVAKFQVVFENFSHD